MASKNKEVQKKRVFMSVVQKLEVIKKMEQGVSMTDICKMYGVGKTTVRRTLKSKTMLQQFLSSYNFDSSCTFSIGNRTNMKFGPNKKLDEALSKWYIQQRANGIDVQHLQLRSKLKALKARMTYKIKSDKGWLRDFKRRRGIVSSLSDKVCRESSDSEKKNINVDKVIPEESIEVGNLPLPSVSPPIASILDNISEESIKGEGKPSPPPIASTRHDISKLNASTIRKRRRKQFWRNKILDEALLKWYIQQRSSGINVQHNQLKSEFNALVNRMRLKIKATGNWVINFRKRHGIILSLGDKICKEFSDLEKKNLDEDQIIPEESIKVENLPSPLPSLPITSTHSKVLEKFIKVENSSESCLSPTDVYHNYIWEECDIKSEGSPSPLDDKSLNDE